MEFGLLFEFYFICVGGFFPSAKLNFLNTLCASVILYRDSFAHGESALFKQTQLKDELAFE